MNEVSSAFGTMEHETWTSLEEDDDLFYMYRGKYKKYSYKLTQS